MSAAGHVEAHAGGMVAGLQRLIRQPSVSARGEGIEECAELVRGMLEESGIRSEVLRVRGAAPLVYGEVRSEQNPSRTVLFYNHYDVQPEEPLDLWDDPPFAGVRRGNRVFGRGATDDKGELASRIWAIRALLDGGGVPCNVKFAIEGEEETGSAHIAEYLRRHRRRLSCDGVIWEFGYVDARDRPVVGLGMKGLLYAELTARGPPRDAHSSLAPAVPNPAWRLLEALRSIRGPSGRILVRDWYREAVPFTRRELELLRREPLDVRAFRREFGPGALAGMSALDAKKALAGGATCNIAGLASGYAGDGAKTVLPSKATAKLDFRLVPRMDPKRQEARLRRHLRERGFGDIGVRVFHGEAAARTDPSDPLVASACRAAVPHMGRPVLSVSNAGTGPMHAFVTALGAPCVSVGSTHVFSRMHSPNEFARVDLLVGAAKWVCGILEDYASAGTAGAS